MKSKYKGSQCDRSCLTASHDVRLPCSAEASAACGATKLAAVLEPTNQPESTTPVLVLINTKSGNRGGEVLYSWFAQLLNPIQVRAAAAGAASKGPIPERTPSAALGVRTVSMRALPKLVLAHPTATLLPPAALGEVSAPAASLTVFCPAGLNAPQVWDVSDGGPETALRLFARVPTLKVDPPRPARHTPCACARAARRGGAGRAAAGAGAGLRRRRHDRLDRQDDPRPGSAPAPALDPVRSERLAGRRLKGALPGFFPEMENAILVPVPLGTGNDFARCGGGGRAPCPPRAASAAVSRPERPRATKPTSRPERRNPRGLRTRRRSAVGWGGGFDGGTLADVIDLLVKISNGFETYVDRWAITQRDPAC
eukprot:SAG11_NODE_2368_length_3448_cov_12.401015_1_plen_368_part_10